jgi:uroporphyrin-III C-methyltransferase/precorrin-2 dehydrogenase/sirohydrochlorin ferrochelatase
VSIYSNILDELEILVAYQIPFEIIPGVTAALGAAAYAGIPLTARGLSTGVRFLTYFKDEAIAPDEWSNLAQTRDTLVFYMSSHPLSQLASRLISAGASPEKPLAVVEQATTLSQRVTLFTLGECLTNRSDFISPALVIIGEVVNLHKRFNWFEAGEPDTAYFNELTSIAPTVQTVQK